MSHGWPPRALRTRAVPLRRGALGCAAAWLLAASGLASCSGPPPALRVGPVGYSTEELGALGDEQRSTLADLTAFGLAVAESRTDELLEPVVTRELRSIVLRKLALEMAVRHRGLTESELEAAYERDPEYELTVRHLVVLSERWRPDAQRDSARYRAVAALDRVRSGEDFEAVAAKVSEEPGADERGGLLEPGRRGSWVPEFWAAASSLEEGEVSDVVETEYGYHVLKLEDRSIVPFDEVRDRVVQRVVDLPAALGQAGEWAAERTRAAAVDTGAIEAWAAAGGLGSAARGGAATGGVVQGGGSTGGAGAASDTLVRWPGDTVSAYTTSDLEGYLLTLPPGAVDAVRDGDRDALLSLVEGAARNALMLHRARGEGIEASASQREAVRARWHARLGGWADALGFAEGQSRSRVKASALEALGAQAQSAMVARSELERLRPALRHVFPVERPAAD